MAKIEEATDVADKPAAAKPVAKKSAAKKSAARKSAERKPAAKKAAAPRPTAIEAPSGSASSATLPLFYRDPRPLSAERHAGKSLRRGTGYGFAHATNVMPLNMVEFGMAARCYPVVFTAGDPPAAVAVLGLRQDHNLFVGPSGEWRLNHYIPAYARRYPFVFLTGRDRERFMLCVDEGSDLVIDGDANPFFKDGKPTEVTDSALRFCSAYQSHHDNTRAFAEALVEHDLLEAHRVDVKLAGGEPLSLAGFRVIAEPKFRELSDKVFLEFRRQGWLPAVYHHLQSNANWGSLANLEDRRVATGTK